VTYPAMGRVGRSGAVICVKSLAAPSSTRVLSSENGFSGSLFSTVGGGPSGG